MRHAWVVVCYLALVLAYLTAGTVLLVKDVQLSYRIFLALITAVPLWFALSSAGSATVWLAASASLFAAGQLSKKWRAARARMVGAVLFFGVWVNLGIAALLKTLIARPRPIWQLPLPELEPNIAVGSMPSGHAQLAFMTAVILGHYYPKARFPLLVLAVAISLSRIALGSHYLLDVLVGTLNGIAIGLLWTSLPWERVRGAIYRTLYKK